MSGVDVYEGHYDCYVIPDWLKPAPKDRRFRMYPIFMAWVKYKEEIAYEYIKPYIVGALAELKAERKAAGLG